MIGGRRVERDIALGARLGQRIGGVALKAGEKGKAAIVVEPFRGAVGDILEIAGKEHGVEFADIFGDLLHVGRGHRLELMIGGQKDAQGLPFGGKRREGKFPAFDGFAILVRRAHEIGLALTGREAVHIGFVTPDVAGRGGGKDRAVAILCADPGLVVLGQTAHLDGFGGKFALADDDCVVLAFKLGEPHDVDAVLGGELKEGVGQQSLIGLAGLGHRGDGGAKGGCGKKAGKEKGSGGGSHRVLSPVGNSQDGSTIRGLQGCDREMSAR